MERVHAISVPHQLRWSAGATALCDTGGWRRRLLCAGEGAVPTPRPCRQVRGGRAAGCYHQVILTLNHRARVIKL